MKASSRGIFEGIQGAYPRALYRAMGYRGAYFYRILIGIFNSLDELNPGHFHLRTMAEWIRQGVRESGGVPAEFNTVTPCDAIAQGKGCRYAGCPSNEARGCSSTIPVTEEAGP
jgi:dihydroxy-acid dehydratase